MNEKQPVSFPGWKSALAFSNLSPAVKASHTREVLAFLHHCKKMRSPVSVVLIRQWLASRETSSDGPAHLALRWFYRAAAESDPTNSQRGAPQRDRPVGQVNGPKQESDGQVLAGQAAAVGPSRAPSESPGRRPDLRPMEPGRAADDLGGPAWEQALVKTIRLHGLLWRTEDTYRSWARRFARFISPKSPQAAAAEEVGAFLSDLATQNRASPSSQRQALNALVFLMEKALGRQLGELDFKRAYPKTRVPVVLTPEECQRVFNQMEGTTRLMAELMYGAGLRLMELLRLRVHHLDLERGQLTVRGGKRDKDRITVIPESLTGVLTRQYERLRVLHAEDRKAGLPGVWLPEGLAKKYQRAGERWEWQWLL